MRRALAAFVKGLGQGGRPVSLLLTNDAEIRALNRTHRGKDRATDVLSWSYLGGKSGGAPQAAPSGGEPLGDLVISLDRAKVQAKDNGWSLHTELLRLLAHGCAHLAGYDHETPAEEREMRTIEEVLLKQVGLTGLYPAAEPERAPVKRQAPRRMRSLARRPSIRP